MVLDSVLTDQQASGFRRDGSLLVPGALGGSHLDELRSWADDVAGRRVGDPSGVLQHYELTATGPRLARSERLVDGHPGFRALIADGALTQMGAALLGESLVLYKEKINYKAVGGAGFAPHQDAPAYPFVDTHITCMVAIDDATIDNGCLEVAHGRHHSVLPDDGDGCIAPSVVARLAWTPIPMVAGDLLWFHSHLPHRSGPNVGPHQRRALFCTYNGAAEGDLRSAYYAEKQRYFESSGAHTSRLSTIGDFQGVAPTDDQLREIGVVS